MRAAPRTRAEKIQASIDYLDALSAKPWTRPPTCENCTHFLPDPINTVAGMGQCSEHYGAFYPRERHNCHYLQTK